MIQILFSLRRCSVLLALCPVVASAQIAPIETAMALADIVRRSLALDLLGIDPFLHVDRPRRNGDFNASLCTSESIRDGLSSGTCRPSKVKLCGANCVELTIDPDVYRASAKRIQADLNSPCTLVENIAQPAGYRDYHPSYFYYPRGRALFVLGCRVTPISVKSAAYSDAALIIRYEAS